MEKIFIDSFSSGLDDLTRQQQGDQSYVIDFLRENPRFSCFDASANTIIASTMTNLCKRRLTLAINDSYPWSTVTHIDGVEIAPKQDRTTDIRRREMKCKWENIDDHSPIKSGCYLVLWSEPYSRNMSRGFKYYNNNTNRFDGNPAGANEVIFWLSGVDEMPDIPREGMRTRLVKE
jgi:hypothetical protein